MAKVLNNEKKQQMLALGQLGWSVRRIKQATRVRRETISTYLKAAGVGVWPPLGREPPMRRNFPLRHPFQLKVCVQTCGEPISSIAPALAA
jgi:hypothetical protein